MELALLEHARQHILVRKAEAISRVEASKGCRPAIAPQPVSLEPPYGLILSAKRPCRRRFARTMGV